MGQPSFNFVFIIYPVVAKKSEHYREHYLNSALLSLHWALQCPLPQVPPPGPLFPLSSLAPPTSVLVAHSEKKRKKWQRLVSYTRGGHCTLFGDGVQQTSDPR